MEQSEARCITCTNNKVHEGGLIPWKHQRNYMKLIKGQPEGLIVWGGGGGGIIDTTFFIF